MIPYLDKDFLRALDQYHHKTVYAKIIALNYQEEPIEQIEGVVTGGSISVDGSSSVRRSCSLTLVAKNLTINNVYWGLSSKVSILIGLENHINPKYESIIWFKQGIYILTDFKTSHVVNNYTISLTGKDKMCLLNGDIGGTFNAETDLGIEYVKNDVNEIQEHQVPIYNIITEMIHHYANEKFSNIVIRDVDIFGLQLLENKSPELVYYLLYATNENYENGIKTLKGILTNDNQDAISCIGLADITKVSDIESYTDQIIFYQMLEEDDINLIDNFENYSIFNYQGERYYIRRIARGDTIGYKPIKLIYPGELIASVGESITSILDKIVKTFGDFEYFYNLDGQFIFQKKQTYINTSWNNIVTINNETYVNPALLSNKVAYTFDNATLITSFANSPQLNNIKNDYTVWGKKRTSDGAEVPIHARYAIDSKPWYYKAFDGRIFITANGYEQYSKLKAEYEEEWLRRRLEEIEASGKILFKKIQVPEYLQKDNGTSDWWDITNWADYYKLLTGSYPDERLDHYGTERPPANTILTFPDGSTYNISNNLIFDTERDTHNPYYGEELQSNGRKKGYHFCSKDGLTEWYSQSQWYPFQHGFTGCQHNYTEFLYLDSKNNCQSFIYKPQIPESSMTDDVIDMIDNIIIDEEFNIDDAIICDWREIIFQMAKDYYQHYHQNGFQHELMKNNRLFDELTLYPTGQTGYEQYYHDINGFWRQLYLGFDEVAETIDLNNYYTNPTDHYYKWHRDVVNAPSELLFWFDFFDNKQSQIEAFSVPAIGDRAKNVSDDNIRAVIYTDTPDIVYANAGDNDVISTFSNGYQIYVDPDGIADTLSISARGKSIHDEIDSMLYKYSFFNNSITLNCLPIYYLEPNTIISVNDELSNIHGYFSLNKFTIPLTYNGTMSITAVEIPQRIY